MNWGGRFYDLRSAAGRIAIEAWQVACSAVFQELDSLQIGYPEFIPTMGFGVDVTKIW
jgi:hypothetical protein